MAFPNAQQVLGHFASMQALGQGQQPEQSVDVKKVCDLCTYSSHSWNGGWQHIQHAHPRANHKELPAYQQYREECNGLRKKKRSSAKAAKAAASQALPQPPPVLCSPGVTTATTSPWVSPGTNPATPSPSHTGTRGTAAAAAVCVQAAAASPQDGHLIWVPKMVYVLCSAVSGQPVDPIMFGGFVEDEEHEEEPPEAQGAGAASSGHPQPTPGAPPGPQGPQLPSPVTPVTGKAPPLQVSPNSLGATPQATGCPPPCWCTLRPGRALSIAQGIR